MTVASGTVPYEYVTSVPEAQFNFRVPPDQEVQPSAVLFEEAMYIAKAEWNRVVTNSSGFEVHTSVDTNFEDRNGTFVKVYTLGSSGVFDPDPTGGYLGGTNVMEFGSIDNSFTFLTDDTPGMIYARDYVSDLREVLNAIFDKIATRSSATKKDVVEDWLIHRKYYNDDG